MKNKKAGFTLIEILIAITIVVILAIMATGALNPASLIGKANDSRRKKDLNRIRTAFEEYANDKGAYPIALDVIDWNVRTNCKKVVPGISKYLPSWPCDPNGYPYTIIMGGNWFKVVTNLDYKKDKDVPEGWYQDTSYMRYTAIFDRQDVNYGVSSPNVIWYNDDGVPDMCGSLNICLGGRIKGECNDRSGVGCSYPDICYRNTCSMSVCRVRECD